MPGTTYGNAALQEETFDILKKNLATQSEHGDCPLSQTNVFDTWATNEPSQSEFNSAFLKWKELWTLDVCGRSLDFQVVYMRHETGIISISISRQEDDEFIELN